jgi:hypothetical protein
LLDHLLQRRDSERGRELVQPPRQSLALNRPKGGPAFRSAERSTEREPQPSSQTEQELEVKETGR